MSSYLPGDYVKVEFSDEASGVGEWMWVIVERCDDARKMVFGRLDSEPLNEYPGRPSWVRSSPSLSVKSGNVDRRPTGRSTGRRSRTETTNEIAPSEHPVPEMISKRNVAG